MTNVSHHLWGDKMLLGSISLMLCLCQQICRELGCSLIAKPINDFLNPHPKHLVSVPPYAKLQELGVFYLTMLITIWQRHLLCCFFGWSLGDYLCGTEWAPSTQAPPLSYLLSACCNAALKHLIIYIIKNQSNDQTFLYISEKWQKVQYQIAINRLWVFFLRLPGKSFGKID